MLLSEILKTKEHTILDVRTRDEYDKGHAPHAINIPLDEVANNIEKINKLPRPIVLCCETGTRSRQAHIYLAQHGVSNTYAGGSWLEIHGLKEMTNY